jgi:hypothetical protein
VKPLNKTDEMTKLKIYVLDSALYVCLKRESRERFGLISIF